MPAPHRTTAPSGASLLDRAERRTAHLAARNLRKGYGEGLVVDDVSLTVGACDRLAIIGDNGAGKSTLLRLLAGVLEPDGGSVACTTGRTLVEQELTADAAAAVATLIDEALHGAQAALAALEHAGAEVAEELPGADERYAAALAAAEELGAWDARRRLDEDLHAFGAAFPEDTPLRHLSPGQRYRLRLACALHDPAGAVLLDEPSNHLDDRALDRLAERLLDHPGITVLVTHDRWLLDAVATAMLDLDPTAEGAGALFGGTFPEFRLQRARRMRRWRERHRDSLREEEQLEYRIAAARAQQPEQWRPAKGSSKHGRSSRSVNTVKALQRRLDQLRLDRPPAPPEPLRFALHDVDAGGDEPLLAAEGLRCDGRLHLPADARIELAPGSRLVLRGPNGAGKSTLLEILAGRLAPDGGTLAIGEHARVGLLAQEDDLDPAQTPLDALGGAFDAGRDAPAAVADGATPATENGAPFDAEPEDEEEALREAVLGTGLLAERDLDRPVGRLSVGQRRRVDLARLVLARPSILLLDEPTNHLSVTLVDDLTAALLETAAAVVLVTHDRTLLTSVREWPELRIEAAAAARA